MQAKLLLRCEPHLVKKARYVLETFFETIGLACSLVESLEALNSTDLLICYGGGDDLDKLKNKVVIRSSTQAANYFRSVVEYDTGNVSWFRWEGKDVPILFSEYGIDSPVMRFAEPNTVLIDYDIVASAFFFLSCWQEQAITEKDQFNRFPYRKSIQKSLDIATKPVVVDYLDILKTAIEQLSLTNQKLLALEPLWKNRSDFAVCLTHDVHTIERWSLQKVFSEARRCASLMLKHQEYVAGAEKFFQDLLSIVKRENPVSPQLLLAQENSFGLHSSFYLMTAGSAPQDPPCYWRDTTRFKDVIRAIELGGSEVGLHQSYETYDNLELMKKEKDRLDDLVQNKSYGGRQHYLRFEVPTTWRLQEYTGLRYDSTLCFAEQEGFRAGFCFPYHPYDLINDRKLEIWELPLSVMDGTLRDYRKLTPAEGLRAILDLISTVKQYQGLLVILWHTDFCSVSPEWSYVYEKILEEVASDHVFAGSGIEILEWWEQRSKKTRGL